jgi:hypothetical protein
VGGEGGEVSGVCKGGQGGGTWNGGWRGSGVKAVKGERCSILNTNDAPLCSEKAALRGECVWGGGGGGGGGGQGGGTWNGGWRGEWVKAVKGERCSILNTNDAPLCSEEAALRGVREQGLLLQLLL